LCLFVFRRLSEKQKRKIKNSAIFACPVGPEDRTGATLRWAICFEDPFKVNIMPPLLEVVIDFKTSVLFRFSCFVVIPIRDASREFLTIYFNKAFDHEHGSESEVCYNEITYHFGVYP